MIVLDNVTKVYGDGTTQVEALRGVSLAIGRGEFVSIMGPSGSGKSTLLNLLSALDAPTSGTIVLDGNDLRTMSDDAITLLRRRRIGLVFQFFNLLPTLTAEENVLLPLLLERRVKPEDRALARRLLDEVDLGARARHTPTELSGGEMQRVAIARAFIYEPPIILADEPTGNLDSSTGADVLALMRRQAEQHGNTVVMVTHDESAARVGTRLVRLRDGRIEADAPVS